MSEDVNVVLVTGTDLVQIEEHAAKLAKEFAGEDADAFGLDVIQETDSIDVKGVLSQCLSSLASPPFFGARKTIWLRRFSAFSEAKKTGALADYFNELTDKIEKGIPSDTILLLSGTGLAKTRKLYKVIKAAGKIIEFDKPDIKSRGWQTKVATLIRDTAASKNLSLPPAIVQYLVDVVGTDTGRVEQELEKLFVAANGDSANVTMELARDMCVGSGETEPWALQNALGERNLDHALIEVAHLLAQDRDQESGARGLVLQTAKMVRQMLQMRVFMQQQNVRNAKALGNYVSSLDAEQKKAQRANGFDFLDMHPFRVSRMAESAMRYTGPELVAAFPMIRDADIQCVTSSISNRLVLEKLLVAIIGQGKR